MYLNEIIKRSNNLSFLKFIAACLVIYSHSFALSLGRGNLDFLDTISKGSLSFGGFAVAIFFFSSGFFITKSIIKRGGSNYIKTRIARIFPPLIVTVALTVIIFGLFFSSLSFFDFIFNKQTLLYCLNMILIPVHMLPGVFSNNVYGSYINGALWTLPVEFACYIAVYVLYKLSWLNEKKYKIISVFVFISYFCLTFIKLPIFETLLRYSQPAYVFFMGSYFYLLRNKIKISSKILMISILCFLLLITIGYGKIATVFCLPYILLYYSFYLKQCESLLAKLGDISYEIYLVGFPIQQMIVSLFGGNMRPYMNLMFALPISIILAFIVHGILDISFYKKIKL
ncbi:acyltransferase family protein [Faecalibacillus faecis]|uniref:acyltransferase family protein n=1 Tax=Faecalibacillus faecis TaxID=1982628 RepID=UPI00386B9785